MLLLSRGGRNGKGGEDLAGDVALEAADRFGLALAVADATGEVVLGALVAVEPDKGDAPERGVRLPVAPAVDPVPVDLALLACTGLTPQSEANERSLTSRWGLSPAARSNVEATSEPKPLRAVKAGATCSVMRNGRGQW